MLLSLPRSRGLLKPALAAVAMGSSFKDPSTSCNTIQQIRSILEQTTSEQVDVALDKMAAVLNMHEDYRVLSRLRPTMKWPDQLDDGSLTRTRRVALVDTETTGLNHEKDKIVEIGLVFVNVDIFSGLPRGPVDVYSALEDPGFPIPIEAQEVHGISDEMVRGQRIDDVKVAEMMSSVDFVCAHNAAFDRPFVDARFPALEGKPWVCSIADIPWKDLGKQSATPKLSSLALDLGWFYNAHRAESDCHALLAVLASALGPANEGSLSGSLPPTGFSFLAKALERRTFSLEATGAPFEKKDLLKARGYRWSPEKRVWHTRLPDVGALAKECSWLELSVFHSKPAKVRVESHSAAQRYSSRPGELSFIEIGQQQKPPRFS